MHCRDFHRNHSAFLDGNLLPSQVSEAQMHMSVCKKCADHDASVRRALLVFRNLPAIEPSRDFAVRLNRKIAHARLQPLPVSQLRLPAYGAFVLAAGLLITVGLARSTSQPSAPLTLAPVFASRPEASASQMLAPAIAASVTAGFPAWPAAIMVEHASQQLADAEFLFVGQTPR